MLKNISYLLLIFFNLNHCLYSQRTIRVQQGETSFDGAGSQVTTLFIGTEQDQTSFLQGAAETQDLALDVFKDFVPVPEDLLANPAWALSPELIDLGLQQSLSQAHTGSTGLSLIVWAIAQQKGLIELSELKIRVQAILDFYLNTALSHEGFYFDLYEQATGDVTSNKAFVSTMDSALLMAGAIYIKQFMQDVFPADSQTFEIAQKVDQLYAGMNFAAAQLSTGFLSKGFDRVGQQFVLSQEAYELYGEVLWLYLLAFASDQPSHAIDSQVWDAIERPIKENYVVEKLTIDGTVDESQFLVFRKFLRIDRYIEPRLGLWDHVLLPSLLDLKNKQDRLGFDYYLNTQRAVLANRQFCLDLAASDPLLFESYRGEVWGLSRTHIESQVPGGERFDLAPFRSENVNLFTDSGRVVLDSLLMSMPFAFDEAFVPVFDLESAEGNAAFSVQHGFMGSARFEAQLDEDGVFNPVNPQAVIRKVHTLDKALVIIAMQNLMSDSEHFPDVPEDQLARSVTSVIGLDPRLDQTMLDLGFEQVSSSEIGQVTEEPESPQLEDPQAPEESQEPSSRNSFDDDIILGLDAVDLSVAGAAGFFGGMIGFLATAGNPVGVAAGLAIGAALGGVFSSFVVPLF